MQNLKNLLLDPYFQNIVESYQGAWREVIAAAVKQGVPVPGFSSALVLLRQLPYRASASELAASTT